MVYCDSQVYIPGQSVLPCPGHLQLLVPLLQLGRIWIYQHVECASHQGDLPALFAAEEVTGGTGVVFLEPGIWASFCRRF